MREIDRRPSKLEELLGAFKNPESGHIEISPRAARTILLERLLAFYRKTVLGSPSANVEVLVQIAGTGTEESDYKPVDFTEALKKFNEERDIKFREEHERQKAGSVITYKPPKAEI